MPKKTMTPKALEANRKNSQNSTGPRTVAGKKRASLNALKYGLASRSLQFDDEEEQTSFQELVQELIKDYDPRSRQEELLVFEIATQFHRSLRSARRVEAAIRAQEGGAIAALNFFVNSAFDECDPRRTVFEPGASVPLLRTHHCSELTLTNAISKESERENLEGSSERSDVTRAAVKFACSLDTLLRYDAQIRRDLHRAIDQLERLQGRRGTGQA
jgi:hypothetical protein